jgi:iron complex outermembrane receptor protein
VYGSYSMARKEPNRDDFEAGQSQLPKPETLRDAELGIEKKNKLSSLGINLFHMNYKDQLVLTGKINDVGAYTRTNIPDSYRLGAELQAGIQPFSWLAAAANFTISKNKIRNYTDFIDDYDNGGQKTRFYSSTDISFSPDIISSASLTVKPVRNSEIALIGKYVGRQYLDNTQNVSRSLDPYYTQDLRLSYAIAGKKFKNVELMFQLNNVFNKRYEPNGYTFSYYYNNTLSTENYYFPMAGRNWMAGLNIRL